MPRNSDLNYFDPEDWHALMEERARNYRKHRKPRKAAAKPRPTARRSPPADPPDSAVPAAPKRSGWNAWHARKEEEEQRRAGHAYREFRKAEEARRAKTRDTRRAARAHPWWHSVLLAMMPGRWHTMPAIAVALGSEKPHDTIYMRTHLALRRPLIEPHGYVERHDLMPDGWSPDKGQRYVYRLTEAGAALQEALS
ncbi:UNVERIFIED_ORG: hypothetical protein ABID33_000530 [Xanthobacter viscosus]|uniref:Uncharacterized protein n=1 Tax=Xanthobacter autotrophicus TaxID=280 RepID=A0A6C1KKM9_XANAU|nr:hypothetical protein [Xanthobacter autotrophicus]TLX43604.1 hypothetical protein FBQ73_05665 [Xanthobacter autotrophicus]